ncbi:hypothetical protein B0H15DRAFT_795923 [Mycena belliarum]|uniref:Uncharacterized protein n=1 Tax=Mycena belliarum TaxID=1033014 RepID=A0AAD6UH79_9AGAR|nr:hypothetical protein B0H15DRAFT_795923 [Mycena belliae]
MTDSSSPTLPVEIWTVVHALACTDGGATARALSLVSRDWLSISAPFKFQSIALVGPKPILRFVALLDSIPEGERNVQSLSIGSQNLRLYPSPSYTLDLAQEHERGLRFTDKLFPELGITSFTGTLQISSEAIDKAVIRILELTSKTLRTLYTHLILLRRPMPLYHVHLPHLQTLVLHGPFASPPPTLSPVFPKLRRLRLAPPLTSGHGGAELLDTIAIAAPILSQLYLSHSACAPRVLERALEGTNLRNLTRLFVEVGAARRSSPSPPGDPVAEPAGLLRLAQGDGRIRIIKERPWWIDVEAALIEWEEVDELQWDHREQVKRDG